MMKRLCLSLCLIVSGTAITPEHGRGASPAEEILAASGIQGGLIVCVGCEDPELLIALRANDRYVVHGLDTDEARVKEARRHIQSLRLYGKIAADTFDGGQLPYTDSLVNLIVLRSESALDRGELERVLCPNGAAVTIAAEGGRIADTYVKPWPDALDQWTHFHHDPQGTMVGRDKSVGPPRRIQWMAGPKWLRNHDFMSSMHAMVSAGGRVFYVMDEGLRNHIFLPARWALIARDGFNGTVLWKKPLHDWHPNNWPLKSGPGHHPRKLVAVGDTVYVAAGLTEPVQALDAATGEALRIYPGTRPTQEILLSDGTLYLLVDPKAAPVEYRAETSTYKEIRRANSQWGWSTESPERIIKAVVAETGEVLWEHPAAVAPLTLTVGDRRVFYHNGSGLVAVDRDSGDVLWTTSGPPVKRIPTGGSLRVVFSGGVVLFASGTNLTAFAAADGANLWSGKLMKTSHHCPEDLFVIDEGVWSVNTGKPQQDGTHFKVMDLRTGEIQQDFVAENLPGFPMHPRCYPSRATTEYIMTNGMGTEFYRVGGRTVDINNFVRGSCIYGVMPCNGFLYKPPDTCACYYQSKLEYLCALAPESDAGEPRTPDGERLEKGPAWSRTAEQKPSGAEVWEAGDWPMYRGDVTRSGYSPVPVPADLQKSWAVQLGGKLTQPVVADGKVFVAAIERHTLYALDAETGQEVWQYTAGGRIDSSPTIHRGKVLFGSADGWVDCLDAGSGQLVWRYLVAPGDKRIVSYEQVESAWPVSGSVLVVDDVLYCLAGRNMFFDGGLRLVLLDPSSGRQISEVVMDENDPRTGKNLQTLIEKKYMPVANADLLSSDGQRLYMQAQAFDLEGNRLGVAPEERPAHAGRHLFCQTGFLDDLWYHRSYWIYGEDCGEGWGNYTDPRKQNPCGRIMVLDESRAYAYRSEPLGNMLHPRTQYRLYAADKNPSAAPPPPSEAGDPKRGRRSAGRKVQRPGERIGGCEIHWQLDSLPLLANAMVLGGGTLFLAGPPDLADETRMLGFLPRADDAINRELQEQEAAWRGERGGLLWAVSAEDGGKLAAYELDSYPVFDGMSAARGGLYLSLLDGSVVHMAAD